MGLIVFPLDGLHSYIEGHAPLAPVHDLCIVRFLKGGVEREDTRGGERGHEREDTRGAGEYYIHTCSSTNPVLRYTHSC